uniref:5'-3' exoribonuclease 2 homolog n=1 Tax=Globodera rostochiensis TaxID=31243 RepID=A0A914HN01_GLORO
MGVPAFFRWLSRKYVSIIVDAVEQRRREIDGVKIPIDATQPNENYQEFDNLYLDMNGIIHPCTHPEDRPAPKTEEEMFILIFEYIDRLFSIVRPRKVLYMAIDGVAPRAKMNQQRSRRFRAAQEAAEKRELIDNVRKRLEAEGIPLPPPRKEEEHFDSNCITPGTPFMARLSVALRYFVHKRISSEPAWQNIQVILSDANVPGEGEHKIMDFVRRQRASPSHDPNTVHCLCGADADLIMLGLATHEANFNIIREEFLPNQPRSCELCGQYGHEVEHCEGLARAEAGPDQADPLKKEKSFIFIRLPVLREYLERELFMPNLPFPFELERAIDDWVMMCFFVGNDFLPHLPSLEIRENAIDRLVKLYKEMVYQAGGWLTENGVVNIGRVKTIMGRLGEVEDEIFKQRQMKELRYKETQRQRKQQARNAKAKIMPYNASLIAPTPLGQQKKMSGEQMRKLAAGDRMQFAKMADTASSQKLQSLLTPVHRQSQTEGDRKRKLAQNSPSQSPNGAPPAKTFKDGGEGDISSGYAESTEKRTIKIETPSGKPVSLAKGAVEALANDSDEEEAHDEIRLWESGWKDRYYQAKFNVSETDLEFRKKVSCAYVEGLCWVLRYYYQGCASWKWFFPYHYAPFASDFELIGDFEPDFNTPTRPFNPLEQLMGVFPAASRAHIPEGWRWLMTDSNSPIIDFYPENFEIDLNGKKYAWQGVALLPFVEEKPRNTTGPDRLFIGAKHTLFSLVHEVHSEGSRLKQEEETKATPATEMESVEAADGEGNGETKQQIDETIVDKSENGTSSITGVEEKKWVHIDAVKAYGMSGQISHDVDALEYGETHRSLFRNSLEFGDINKNACVMVEFLDPQFPLHFIFKANRLDGIKELPRVLKPQDWDHRRPFQPQIGFSRDIPRANLSMTGHRTLNHHINDNRRSCPASLFAVQTTPPPTQTLPWHISPSAQQQQRHSGYTHHNAPQQWQQQSMYFNSTAQQQQLPVPLFSFGQMAMPPPPPPPMPPPQNWINHPPPQMHPHAVPTQPAKVANQKKSKRRKPEAITMGTRKRMGMFDHAKYSKPVLRSITEPVQKAVNRDINKLLDYGAAAVRFRRPEEKQPQQKRKLREMMSDVSVVEDSFDEQEDEVDRQRRKKFCPEIELNKRTKTFQPPVILASSFRPPERPMGLGRDPTFIAVRDALLKACPVKDSENAAPGMDAEERIAMLLNPGAQQRTPIQIQQRSHLPESQPVKSAFPTKCPLDRIADRLMDSFPSITLKNNEPQTLVDATFTMAKRALLAAQERQAMNGGAVTDGECSGIAPSLDLNPFKSLKDQTVCLFHTSEGEKDFYHDRSREVSTLDESPTADIVDDFLFHCASQLTSTKSTQRTSIPRIFDDGNPQTLCDFFESVSGVDQSGVSGSTEFDPHISYNAESQAFFDFFGSASRADQSGVSGSLDFNSFLK